MDDLYYHRSFSFDIKGNINQGFILIDSKSSNEKMAVRDHFLSKGESKKKI